MTPCRPLSSERLVFGAAIVAALMVTGCPEDEGPGKLFEEDGAWELTQYDLDGSGFQDVTAPVREEAFLLQFDAANQVAQLAMCAETEDDTPADSLCNLSTPAETAWFCGCFAYAYEEDVMQWRQFAAGETPPSVELDADGSTPPATDTATATDTDGGSGGGEGTGGVDPGADTQIQLTEVSGVTGAYIFSPLPAGFFGSDGLVSRYHFQQRAPSKFDQVFEDPEGRTGCQPCIP